MDEPTGLNNVLGRIATRVRATKSVMASLQWLLPVMLPSCLVGMIWGPPDYRNLFAVVFVAAPSFYALAFIYFGITDPDRLHTEDHREVMTQLERNYIDSRGVVVAPGAANTAPPQALSVTPPLSNTGPNLSPESPS